MAYLTYSSNCRGGAAYSDRSYVIYVDTGSKNRRFNKDTTEALLIKQDGPYNLENIKIRTLLKAKTFTSVKDYLREIGKVVETPSPWALVKVLVGKTWMSGTRFYTLTQPSTDAPQEPSFGEAAEEVLKATEAAVYAMPDALARRHNGEMPVWSHNGRHLFHSEGQWWIGDCVELQRGYLLIEGCDSGDPRQLDLTETMPMVWQNVADNEEWLMTNELTVECSEEVDDSGMPMTVTVGGTSGIESCDERLLGAYSLTWRKGPKTKAKVEVVKPTLTPEGADGLPETGIVMGAYGPGIQQLQTALSDATNGELTFATPGYFGPPTRDAIKALQRRTDGLRVSGTLDALTRQWLLDHKTPGPFDESRPSRQNACSVVPGDTNYQDDEDDDIEVPGEVILPAPAQEMDRPIDRSFADYPGMSEEYRVRFRPVGGHKTPGTWGGDGVIYRQGYYENSVTKNGYHGYTIRLHHQALHLYSVAEYAEIGLGMEISAADAWSRIEVKVNGRWMLGTFAAKQLFNIEVQEDQNGVLTEFQGISRQY